MAIDRSSTRSDASSCAPIVIGYHSRARFLVRGVTHDERANGQGSDAGDEAGTASIEQV
jgi:hypothetical protein